LLTNPFSRVHFEDGKPLLYVFRLLSSGDDAPTTQLDDLTRESPRSRHIIMSSNQIKQISLQMKSKYPGKSLQECFVLRIMARVHAATRKRNQLSTTRQRPCSWPSRYSSIRSEIVSLTKYVQSPLVGVISLLSGLGTAFASWRAERVQSGQKNGPNVSTTGKSIPTL
jgi:hypothetical protein